MKTTILTILAALCLYYSAACAIDVDRDKYHQLVQDEVFHVEQEKERLYDAFDIYMYYFYYGKIAGLMEARRLFDDSLVMKPLSQPPRLLPHPH